MSTGIIVHISVGKEKRTEYFSEQLVRIGASEDSELQINHPGINEKTVWISLQADGEHYRIIEFDTNLTPKLNGNDIVVNTMLEDGDEVTLPKTAIAFSFYSFEPDNSIIHAHQEHPVAPFIEDAAIESAHTEKRDDAKAFLREFTHELYSEISWSTKLIFFIVLISIFAGTFYVVNAFYREMQRNRELTERQSEVIKKLEGKITKTNDQMSELDQSNRKVFEIMSLAPKLRVEFGNSVCLIVGVYDLVDKKSGRILRYPDPNSYQPDIYDEYEIEEGMYEAPPEQGLTTAGNGAPVEYDFIGTGFYVGDGYILTNRHVLRPWTEDELVKQMMRDSSGRARIKRLVVYFPNSPRPIPLSIKKVGKSEDIAVASVNASKLPKDIPVIPLETNKNEPAVGKTVVSMGYPNGPDRLLAMADDREAKAIAQKYGSSRQALINYLAQSGKITPLTTQGTITDLDPRRVVHDAATAEGGSGAPLFGQTGKVIGVNFGVFSQSNAANMAIPISFAIDLLRQSGWQIPESQTAANQRNSLDNNNAKQE